MTGKSPGVLCAVALSVALSSPALADPFDGINIDTLTQHLYSRVDPTTHTIYWRKDTGNCPPYQTGVQDNQVFVTTQAGLIDVELCTSP